MKLGLQIPYFTWPGGPGEIGARLGEIVRAAEDAGYDSIWVMDHHFQIPMVGAAEMDMLEAYATLAYIAAQTSRVRLGTMITGVTYRHPGILVKQVTTLDVLSGGRANLGIGAAWFEREHVGLGVPFPPLRERFERLEEALQIADQMWSDNNGPFEGKHYQLAETLNVPQSISRPHPPIMVGGNGEKKTLRLAARYGDACNLPGASPEDAARKFRILREHCEHEGRDYTEIEKTVLTAVNLGDGGMSADQLVQRLGEYADAGAQSVIGALIGMERLAPFEMIARDVMPQIAAL